MGFPIKLSAYGLLTLSNKGWLKASYKLILKYGLKTKILFKNSIASSGAPGYLYFIFTLYWNGKESKYSKAFWSVTKLISSSFGVPITANITAS